ncbi:uncharacterized protein LOC135225658 isoform X2 [Macrobrachium nipponense]|uniref:uncharacterized protein LOC135225658 isoform X2 n=1 Tax=Macrobrachium nipponense TaxID=159736 RepID=UPI0030C82135
MLRLNFGNNEDHICINPSTYACGTCHIHAQSLPGQRLSTPAPCPYHRAKPRSPGSTRQQASPRRRQETDWQKAARSSYNENRHNDAADGSGSRTGHRDEDGDGCRRQGSPRGRSQRLVVRTHAIS